MRRFRYWCGVFLIGCALVALAAPSVVGSYVGGSASYGSIEDGRYFVGGHSVHKEVSEFEWWLELRVSQSFPWATLVPGFLGLILVCSTLPPGPIAAPPSPSREHLTATAFIPIPVIATGAALGWFLGRAPWTAELGAWLGLYVGGWLALRVLRRLSPQSFVSWSEGKNDPAHTDQGGRLG
jgi:hypothetical protein